MNDAGRELSGVSDESRELTIDSLSGDQLRALKQIWGDVQSSGSSTPMGDLRTRMTDSDQFDFMRKYNINNLQLRALAEMSSNADSIIRNRRRSELEAVLRAVDGKNTPVARLQALQEAGILGDGSGIRMSYEDIGAFVREAEAELGEINNAEMASDEMSEHAGSNMPEADVLDSLAASAEVVPAGLDGPELPAASTDMESVDLSIPDSEDQPESGDSPDEAIVEDEASLTVVAINASVDLRQASIDFANKRLTNELTSGGNVFRRLVRNIWKGNIAKDYYRAKYAREAEERLVAEGNFLSGDASAAQLAGARQALFDRFSLEYDEAIHNEAGESREFASDESEFAVRSKELIRRYVEAGEGEFNRESLDQELNRLIRELSKGENPILSGGELISVSNLADIAEAVKARVDHGQSIDDVLSGMQFVTGESRSGVRTDLRETNVTKLFEKMRKSKNGILRGVAPDTLLLAAGVAGSLAGLGGKRLTATAMTLVPGAAGAFIAGRREWVRTKEDRIEHAREMAQGGIIESGSKRRIEMEGARYQTKSASDLAEALRELGAGLSGEGGNRSSALRDALQGLADVNTRISYGDAHGVDLLSFSDVGQIGDERLALDIARAELMVMVDETLSGMSPSERSAFGLGVDATAALIVGGRSSQFEDVIENDISAKDRAFRKIRNKRVARAAAIGAAGGVTFGLVGQEIFASFDAGREGLIEGLWSGHISAAGADGAIHNTLLESWVNGEADTMVPSVYQGPLVKSDFLGGYGNVTAPDGITFRDDSGGVFSMLDKNGDEILASLSVDSDGRISASSMDSIVQKGFDITESNRSVTIPGQDVERVVVYDDPGEFVRENGGVEIAGRSWADNDTVRPDKNELRLWEMGVDTDGTIQSSIHTMTEGGSYGQGLPVDWRESAEKGELVALITGSRGTQNWAFEMPISADGSFNVEPSHPAYKLFDVTPGEDWKAGDNFKGAFIEVAQKSVNPDGTISAHMLATDIGQNSPGELTGVIEIPGQPTERFFYDYDVAAPANEAVRTHTEMAPAIPIVGRRSMERLGRRSPGYWYGSRLSAAESQRMVSEFSPSIQNSPDAKLNLAEELDWYSSEMRRRDGEEYAAEVESAAENLVNIRNNPNILNIITIPVRADGLAESEGIYDLLGAYAHQDDSSTLGSTSILLHVNHKDIALQDADSAARIEKTRQEIERAKHDYPLLKIDVIETIYPESRIPGSPVGHVAKKLQDAALMAVKGGIEEGGRTVEEDVLIIRNDADAKGISPSYISSINRAAKKYPETDIFTGETKFDHTKERLPGLMFVANFMQLLATLHKAKGAVHTGGANFAVRASTLAAVGGIDLSNGDYGAGTDDVAIGRKILAARTKPALITGSYSRPYYPSPAASGRRIQRVVGGAIIDTDSDREEDLYSRGVPIVNTWNPEHGFNSGKQRDASKNRIRERVGVNTSSIIDRIQNDMEGTIRIDGDRAIVETALQYVFRRLEHAGGRASDGYRMEYGSGGEVVSFRFTRAGRRCIEDQLKHDHRGRRVSYGRRRHETFYDNDHRARLNRV